LPYPAKHVNLRGVEEEKYVLIDITEFERGGNAKLVEEIEISRALFEVYEGGVVRFTRYSARGIKLTLFLLVYAPRPDVYHPLHQSR
jgi:hypothetical protein